MTRPETVLPRPALPRLAVLLPAMLALAACRSLAPAPAAPFSCDHSALQWAVGQSGEETTMRRLASEAGPVLINPVGPASVASRDTRRDRLRVYLDADNTITAVRCE